MTKKLKRIMYRGGGIDRKGRSGGTGGQGGSGRAYRIGNKDYDEFEYQELNKFFRNKYTK